VILPHDQELEQGLIASMLMDNNVISDVYHIVAPSDFYATRNANVVEIIYRIYAEGAAVDILAVHSAAKSNGGIGKIGGATYLSGLIGTVPMSENAVAHAEKIAALSMRRRILAACNEINKNASNLSIDEKTIVSQAYTDIEKAVGASIRSQEPMTVGSYLEDAIDRYEVANRTKSNITGVSTGISELDTMTMGLQNGNFYILAGRPSMGKTAFALNIGRVNCMHGGVVHIFSIEQPGRQLTDRLIAAEACVSSHKLKQGFSTKEEWQRVVNACSRIDQWRLWVDDDSEKTVADIVVQAKRLAIKEKPDIIIIDYMQIIKTTGNRKRHEQIGEVSRSLASLAKSLDVPVLALSQLNRAVEERMNKRPVLADLRDSGSLEQDAHGVIMIYRGEAYGEPTADGETELLLRKNRDGPIGVAKVYFDKACLRFNDTMRRM